MEESGEARSAALETSYQAVERSYNVHWRLGREPVQQEDPLAHPHPRPRPTP
jgi:hypothetical protein